MAAVQAGKTFFKRGGPEFTRPVSLPVYTVATVPSAADFPTHMIYVSNGNAGAPTLAYSNGTNWLVASTAAPIAAA